eukprot:15324000-Ditylum_brightwellii.AAC.1
MGKYGKYGKICNSSCYKGKGKHRVLGGINWWFGPGRNARIKTNYLIWYPACPRSQWLGVEKIWRRSKVTMYDCYQSCGAGSWLWGSKNNPG